MKNFKVLALSTMLGATMAFSAACGSDEASDDNTQSEAGDKLQGSVIIDGSSTVFPIMEAVAYEYYSVQPEVEVPVGLSGSGGGFKKFVVGETDLSNASRPIKQEEADIAKENNIKYIELELAFDGLTIVVNKTNDFAKDLTVEDLRKIWLENDSLETKKWSDINPDWPAEEIEFYAPGTDSGTYDYFDEVILEEKQIEEDNITLSEDDNTLVTGVSGDDYAIGFFGYAYYLENQDKLTAVKINGVEPNGDTIETGEYTPLSRPLFTYVNVESLGEAQVYDFVHYTLENAAIAAEEVGYVRLPQEQYDEQLAKIEEHKK
ncbi:PstS family phosphate ABC transporter substrate-binding protein [Cytobacillus sp. IB215316]|uniref:PstS family phosphate ABC transporter substrate-binding protein n=1 Tax=Cytobacillus sp. IB215316 TaxID=3097354 RepID=UPI002A0BE121|nr:PstS family phosphate ABC transporter substrate-binding protein [Cytobacillus sp. IB215316]MDX8359581.1 PstS family phosphate ABC transporter substrate-binding protein [Cytobacillus sp. IB215316]